MNHRLVSSSLGLSALALALVACGPSENGQDGGVAAEMELDEASNGFGRLLPYEVARLDESGNPTSEIVAIRSQATMTANVRATNPILPPTEWPEEALLPNSEPGNHFFYARFRNPIDPAEVFEDDGELKGTFTAVSVNPVLGTVVPIPGRVFVGGLSPDDDGALIPWVAGTESAQLEAVAPNGEAVGFPGTQSAFQGASDLVSVNSLVFVPDTDGNLATHETFPTGVQLRFKFTTGFASADGRQLNGTVVASSTVGLDQFGPEVAQSPPPFRVPSITPGNADIDIDPETRIAVEFTEPVQPSTIGTLIEPAESSSAVRIQFGVSGQQVAVPYRVFVPSVFDLTRLELKPAFALPGSSPEAASIDPNSNRIDVLVNPNQIGDLVAAPNMNTLNASTFFRTGEGAGVVNAPISPDTIYLGRLGSQPSISVVDLNGFGQSTGTPAFNDDCPITEDRSNFPNNPNVANQGSALIPPLTIGTSTLNGGSEGIFSLTKDSNLSDRLFTGSGLSSVADMMIGHSLDGTFNNGPPPFGCQAEGGNICAATANKNIQFIQSGNVLLPGATVLFGTSATALFGSENPISWAPHPNPPPLSFPPLCLSPFIAGQEPTSVDTLAIDLLGNATVFNQLGPSQGNLLGLPSQCIPPQGILSPEQNSFFEGPSLPGPQCSAFGMRQQVGHFLYVCDRVRGELLVLNSNRFSLIDRISLPDPTNLAMSPNLDFLAVSNEQANTVSFVDINPSSSTFHQVIKETLVGIGPTGIAWDPGNEDILCCNTSDNTISIISAFSFTVRRTLNAQLSAPFDLAITQRQSNFGFTRNVYFGWILNGDGTVAIFESGPDGQNGWGFDNIIGRSAFRFPNAKAVRADPIYLSGGVWIIHEDDFGRGQVSNLVIESASFGQTLLVGNEALGVAGARDIEFAVRNEISSDQLTGIPVDISFDNQRNLCGLPNQTTAFSAGTSVPINGKALVKGLGSASYTPRFMFLAVPVSDEGPGVVDVINIDGGFSRFDTNPFEPGVQSIQASGVNIVADYFRQ